MFLWRIKMNYFIEGIQGSGKSTALRKITEKYGTLTPVREGDYSPVELAWCAYTNAEEYNSILRQFDPIHKAIEEKTFSEEDKKIICYTQIQTDIPDFYQTFEQYEIYNGRKPLDEFCDIVLSRFRRWSGDNMVFECSLFQNIIEDMILFRNMPDSEIIRFYRSVREALKHQDFRLIYIKTDDIAGNIDVIRKERSDENGNELWFPMMCGFFNDSPYAKANGLSGEDDLMKHFALRQELELRICNELFADKITILNSKQFDDITL